MSDIEIVGANIVAYLYPASLISSSIFTVTFGPYFLTTLALNAESPLSVTTSLING